MFAELEENVKIQLNNELELYYIGIENVDIRIHAVILNKNGAERLIIKIREHRHEEYQKEENKVRNKKKQKTIQMMRQLKK